MTISSIKTSDGVVHEIKDTISRSRSIEFIKGTQSTATGSWTGVSTKSELYDGMTINYWLPYDGSGNASLNLQLSNNTYTGAKPIYRTGTSRLTTQYGANSLVPIVYIAYKDAWYVHADYNTDLNTVTAAYCTTDGETAAKAATFTSYVLRAGQRFNIIFSKANAVASAITLNINSAGAKPLWINGAASSSTNYTLPASVYECVYDGTKYMIRTDGKPVTEDGSTIENMVDSRIYQLGVTGTASYDSLLSLPISSEDSYENQSYSLVNSINNYAFLVFMIKSVTRDTIVGYETVPVVALVQSLNTNVAVMNTFFYTVIIKFTSVSTMSVINIVGKSNEEVSLDSILGVRL